MYSELFSKYFDYNVHARLQVRTSLNRNEENRDRLNFSYLVSSLILALLPTFSEHVKPTHTSSLLSFQLIIHKLPSSIYINISAFYVAFHTRIGPVRRVQKR